MSPRFVKPGTDVMSTSLHSMPKEFKFPYTTEDPDEIALLVGNGAIEQAAPASPSPKKTSAAEGEGE